MEIAYAAPIASLGAVSFPDWYYQMDVSSSIENIFGPDSFVVLRGMTTTTTSVIGSTE